MTAFHVLVTAPQWLTEAQTLLRNAGGVLHFMDEPINPDTLIQQLQRHPIEAMVLRGSKPLSAQVLAARHTLKVIAKNGAGVDNVDLQAASARGVTVAVAAGGNAQAVAEHAIALMLTLVRQLNSLDAKVKQGGWEGTSWMGRDFRGSVVGILGYGSIGQCTAQLATALGAEVVVHGGTRRGPVEVREESDLDAFLSQIDILSLHCPLTDRTRGMIGTRELALMKPGSLIVNTARGAIIDEVALVAALRSGHLGGAGLDTFAQEPIESTHPLLSLHQVVVTPHVAGVTRKAVTQVALMTAQNILDVRAGKPLPPRHWVAGPLPGARA